MSLRVLVITPDFPFPTIHGGRVDYFHRIKCLAEFGLEIDLISTVSEDIPDAHISEMKKYAASVTIVKRSTSWKDIFSLIPHQILSRSELATIHLKSEMYDFVLVEGEYVLSILNNPALKYKKSYLRVHNIENKYFYALGLSAFPKITSFYYFFEAFKFYRIQEKIYRDFDQLLFVSADELQLMKGRYNAVHLLTPHSKNEKMKPYVKRESRSVLFIGSLFMPNNVEAVEYYLKEIHNRLLDIPGYKFIVVGSVRRKEEIKKHILTKFKKYDSVEFYFDAEDDEIKAFYETARVFVNPILHGAGVKLKVFEAIRNGLPIVSTPEGVAGSDLQVNAEILVGNNAEGLAHAIQIVLNGEVDEMKLISNAQLKMNSSYNYLAELFSEKALAS